MDNVVVYVASAILLFVMAAFFYLTQTGRLNFLSRTKTTTDSHSGGLNKNGEQQIVPLRGVLIPRVVTDPSPAGSALELLESSASPVVIEYFPLSDIETSTFDLVPVSPTLQKAMLDIINAAGTKGEVLYKAVLPEGLELVKAVGKEGFRGFARHGSKTAHAVLKPVVVGGAAAISWPVVAVTATLLVLDSAAQYQQRQHQKKVETILTRQESRYFQEQIARLAALDQRLNREVNQILDGNAVSLEDSRTGANILFHSAKQFLDEMQTTLETLPIIDGVVDFRKLDAALGGKTKDVDYFWRRLHLAQSAIALEKRAVIAYAAAIALADPENPYAKLQSVLENEAAEIEQSEKMATALTETLAKLELKGTWLHKQRDKFLGTRWAVESRQKRLRERIENLRGLEQNELQFVVTSSGDLRQLVKKGEVGQIPND